MFSEKENFVRVVRYNHPSHVCYPPPSCGISYAGSSPTDSRPSADCAYWRDEWGVGWQDVDGEIFPTLPAVASYQQVYELRVPDPHEPARMIAATEYVAGMDRERYFLAAGHSYFLYEKAINILGPEEFLVAMAEEPGAAHALLDKILDFEMGIAQGYLRFQPEHINLSDDYGHQDRLAMSPAMWREFIKPRLKRIIDFYRHELGADIVVSLHSCGHIMPILEDFIELGVDVLHPVQSTANNLTEVRRLTSGQLTLAGGIDGQIVLPFGTPEEVRAEVFTKLAMLWEDGGFLPLPEKMLGVGEDNERAMVEAIREWSHAQVER